MATVSSTVSSSSTSNHNLNSSAKSQGSGANSNYNNIISVISDLSKKPTEIQQSLLSLKDLSFEQQQSLQFALQERMTLVSSITNMMKLLFEGAQNIIRNFR